MKTLRLIFIVSVVTAPVVFIVYYNYGLVCAPRAYIFEAVTGGISLALFLPAYRLRSTVLYAATAAVPVYIIIIAPITMIKNWALKNGLTTD